MMPSGPRTRVGACGSAHHGDVRADTAEPDGAVDPGALDDDEDVVHAVQGHALTLGGSYQLMGTSYARIAWSAETRTAFSARACAISIRSKGSRWCSGSSSDAVA